jgi:hypothetical protein
MSEEYRKELADAVRNYKTTIEEISKEIVPECLRQILSLAASRGNTKTRIGVGEFYDALKAHPEFQDGNWEEIVYEELFTNLNSLGLRHRGIDDRFREVELI